MFANAPPEAAPLWAGPLADTIRSAFASVLQRDDIADDDDFFDLGGDSILAVELFLQLSRATGREHPVTSIYDAPTVRALARMLASPPVQAAPRSCVVPLRAATPGGPLPPLFIVHGIDGLILTFAGLAAGIADGRAVYGIEAPGIDGATPPLDRIEAMAARYIDAIRAIQPQGPYVLAGYSFGGLVAFEMACRLRAGGATVERLVLIDTMPHPDSWPLDARMLTFARLLPAYASPRVLRRIADYALRRLQHASRASGPSGIGRALRRAAVAPFDVSHAGFLTRMAAAPQRFAVPGEAANLAALAQVNESCVRAYRAWRPGRFADTVDFLQAAVGDFLPYAPHRVWRGRAPALRVRAIPGGHMSLVRGNVASTAEALSDCLRRVPDAV